MNLFDKYFARTVFVFAAIIALFAIAEAVANLLGYSLIARIYTAGKLLQLAAILLVFVIVQLLRQIRDALRTQ